MNNKKQYDTDISPKPWQSPEITTLSINRTEQLPPPDPQQQS